MEPTPNSEMDERQDATESDTDDRETTKGKRALAPRTLSNKRPAQRISRKALEKAFPRAYIENNFNGTKAYLALKPHVKPITATIEASNTLSKPNVQQALEALLEPLERPVSIISEAMRAARPDKIEWKDVHKFIETDLKLRGLLANKEGNKQNINVALLIKPSK